MKEKPYTLEDFYEGISFIVDAKFFILDLKEGKSIAVESESEHGYNGTSFKEERHGYNTSPCYIAKTYVENEAKRYDFTKVFQTALDHASTPQLKQ